MSRILVDFWFGGSFAVFEKVEVTSFVGLGHVTAIDVSVTA